MKYRKKPVVVEAWQWSGGHTADAPDWVQRNSLITWGRLRIGWLDGSVFFANNGDYIINEFGLIYPCKPDIFEASYERVE